MKVCLAVQLQASLTWYQFLNEGRNSPRLVAHPAPLTTKCRPSKKSAE